MGEMKIPEEPDSCIFYFGDSFFIGVDHYGQPIKGNDMIVLEIENMVPIAVNYDQSTIPQGQPRIIAGGSGPDATITWLTFINEELDKIT